MNEMEQQLIIKAKVEYNTACQVMLSRQTGKKGLSRHCLKSFLTALLLGTFQLRLLFATRPQRLTALTGKQVQLGRDAVTIATKNQNRHAVATDSK